MSAQTLFILILCNLSWSFHPLMGKLALESFSPGQTAWLRYGSAALTYAIACLFMRRGAPRLAHPRTTSETILLLALGLAPFAVSPILQLSGLATTQSIDNAIIIAMEPLMTVLLGWLALREGLNRSQWMSFVVAIAGFLLLSRFDFRSFSAVGNAQFMGSVLMLTALWGEAIYSVFGRLLTRKFDPVPLYGTAILVGFAGLSLYVLSTEGLPDFRHGALSSWLAILWLGPLGSCLNYILWMREVKNVPVATLAITLFIQPVVGMLAGLVFRDESLLPSQWIGTVLILTGVAIQAHFDSRAARK